MEGQTDTKKDKKRTVNIKINIVDELFTDVVFGRQTKLTET